jgi:hypothetical protein
VTAISASGISANVPAGWDGRISVRGGGAATALHAEAGEFVMDVRAYTVVHLANFALPEARGDFGSGAVELMGPNDVFIVLFEYEPSAVETALFASHAIPWPLPLTAFDPSRLKRAIRGQAGAQSFFQTAGRAFCLYVVLGSSTRRAALVPPVNQVLGTVTIAPG